MVEQEADLRAASQQLSEMKKSELALNSKLRQMHREYDSLRLSIGEKQVAEKQISELKDNLAFRVFSTLQRHSTTLICGFARRRVS